MLQRSDSGEKLSNHLGVTPLLLVDGQPRRQVVGHHAPVRAHANEVAQTVEHLTQRIAALAGVFSQQHQVGGDEDPFLVAHEG